MVLLQKDVLRFDVAMDDALGVRVGERIGDLVDDAHRVRDGELPFPREPVPERFACYVRHDVVQQVLARAGRKHGENVRVLEMRGELDLLLESRGGNIARELRGQHLDNHLAVQR